MVAGKEVPRLVSIETHQAAKTALGKNQRRFFIVLKILKFVKISLTFWRKS